MGLDAVPHYMLKNVSGNEQTMNGKSVDSLASYALIQD
jgi:hypothetical protein